jgi:hypothetical protein
VSEMVKITMQMVANGYSLKTLRRLLDSFMAHAFQPPTRRKLVRAQIVAGIAAALRSRPSQSPPLPMPPPPPPPPPPPVPPPLSWAKRARIDALLFHAQRRVAVRHTAPADSDAGDTAMSSEPVVPAAPSHMPSALQLAPLAGTFQVGTPPAGAHPCCRRRRPATPAPQPSPLHTSPPPPPPPLPLQTTPPPLPTQLKPPPPPLRVGSRVSQQCIYCERQAALRKRQCQQCASARCEYCHSSRWESSVNGFCICQGCLDDMCQRCGAVDPIALSASGLCFVCARKARSLSTSDR